MSTDIRDNKPRPIILWVEDDAYIEELDFIRKEVTTRGFELQEAPGVRELRYILGEIGDMGRIRGIILDIRIHGASDLEAFNLPNIHLGKGDETGIRLVEHVFRNEKEDNEFRALNRVSILALSVKPTASPSDFGKHGENIKLVKKFDRFSKWELEVKRWIAERAR